MSQKTPKKKKQTYRKGKVSIDRWDEISEHLREIAIRFSHCEHEVGALMNFFAKFYLCGFSHGIAHGMLKAKRPLARKVRYATPDDLPDTRLARSMVEFYRDMKNVHEAPESIPVPVSWNN